MNRFAAIITAVLLLSLVFTGVISQPAGAASQHYILAKVKTADGLPLAGVTITARNVSTGGANQSYYSNTDSNGSVLIPVSPGLYNITATLKGYAANTTYTDANLQTGNFSSLFTMIPAHGNLTGFVTNGIITVANATVTLSNTTSGNSTISYSTHSTAPLGKYSISGIPAGKYNVSAVKKGYIINDTAIYILPGSQIWMNFTLTPILGEIIGIVNTTTGTGAGRPLGFANVTITGSGGTFRTVTNTNGVYEVTNIPQGTYTIKVQKNGYLPGQGSVTISVSRVTYLNFTVLALSQASLLPISGFIGKLDLDHSLMFVALAISIFVVAGTVTLLNKTYNWRDESEENEEGSNKDS